MTNSIPPITVSDSAYKYDLHKAFKDNTHSNPTSDSFDIAGHDFQIKHTLVKKSKHALKHTLYLCANGREVSDIDLGKKHRHLPLSLLLDNESWVYCSIIESSYLDEHVNSDRSGFNLPSEDDDLLGMPGLERIIAEVQGFVADYLGKWVTPEKEKSLARIRSYIMEEVPQYRGLLKTNANELENLPTASMSDTDLDIALYKLQAAIEAEQRGQYKAFLEKTENDDGIEAIEQKFTEILQTLETSSKDKLVSYVVSRKKIITIFQKLLSVGDRGKFPKEMAIHNLIFPMNKTSDEVNFKDHNLWLVDEKLVFHQYLASDKPLSAYEPMDSGDTSRPDLAVYQPQMHGFADNNEIGMKNALTIIEFKRPQRDDYSSSDNPVAQLIGYANKIRSSKCRDFRGRILELNEHAPVYGYIICDITPGLKEIMRDNDFKPFPDGEGYYRYFDVRNIFIEVKCQVPIDHKLSF